MSAFVAGVPLLPSRFGAVSGSGRCGVAPSPCRVRSQRGVRMVSGVDDKKVVTEYFNNTGFDRWNRIYSEDGEVNSVQLDIREGHAQTVDKILKWLDDDGDVDGMRICDAGCGVGSLTLPLLQRGAVVAASDISDAMVQEAARRGAQLLPDKMPNVTFSTLDLESIGGTYDTVCCIDVMIHYPTAQAVDMIAKLVERSERRVIISFAPKTFLLAILKKIGELFPGPSKATRAYLHDEADIRRALEGCGFKVRRSEFTGTRFYFSRLLEAVKE
ncbi:Mg-protoporphyrin IX methyl transferase [Gracilaria domingensis]|nr:Mg-protoporphyrin IX methyl transferase [Gracilaria domingensis]